MLFVMCYIRNTRLGAEWISKNRINYEVLSVFLYLFFQATLVFYNANYLERLSVACFLVYIVYM